MSEPETASDTLTQARALHNQGRLPEAVALYRQVLTAEPRNSDALHLCGLAMASLGDPQNAVRLIGAAAQLQPNNAAIHTNLGSTLNAMGRLPEALACFERAVAL